MIRRLMLHGVARQERKLGASLEYIRHIIRASVPAALKFGMFTPMAEHRKLLPAVPYWVARLVATQREDCGTCVQIEVNLALEDGVPGDVVRATLDGNLESLPDEAREAYAFAQAVLAATDSEGPHRERLRELYGEAGLVELALGMAAARVFPVTKRALGYAVSCSAVDLRVP